MELFMPASKVTYRVLYFFFNLAIRKTNRLHIGTWCAPGCGHHKIPGGCLSWYEIVYYKKSLKCLRAVARTCLFGELTSPVLSGLAAHLLQ